MCSQESQSGIQLAHEHFSSSGLNLLKTVIGGLYIEVRLKQKNQVDHDPEPRTRALTSCHVVNSSGCWRKCSMRRSSSAITSLATGTSDGFASRSFQSSETKISFSDGLSFWTSGNFSRIMPEG